MSRHFTKMEVLAYQVCFCAADIMCIKIETAYSEPSIGTVRLKHLVSLGLDHYSPVGSREGIEARRQSNILAPNIGTACDLDSIGPLPQRSHQSQELRR